MLKSIPSPDDNIALYLFGLLTPAAGAQTVIVNWTNLGDNISYHIMAETVNGSLDVDGMNIASGHVGQVASVSVPSKAGDLLLDFGGGDQYVGSLTIGSGQTSEYQDTTPPQVFMSLKAGKAGMNTMSWTFAPTGEIQDWVDAVISIPVSKLPTTVTGVNVAINSGIPPLSYGFFNYLNTYYEGIGYGRVLPIKLVGYVQV